MFVKKYIVFVAHQQPRKNHPTKESGRGTVTWNFFTHLTSFDQ